MNRSFIPVLLAGGLGTRLWPLSREIYPKQLINVTGDGSLLQQAARRALDVAPPSSVITVTTEAHYLPVRDQLGELDAGLTEQILLEPAGRNTAAAIALAALHARVMDANALLFVMPADHVIGDRAALTRAAAIARDAAAAGWLVTFGITPDRPETGYGYIRLGPALDSVEGACAVDRFVEKPDRARAEAMLAEGNVLWNSGMFVFAAAALLSALEKTAAPIRSAAESAYATLRDDAGARRFSGEAYGAIPSEPIDKAVMERFDRVAVVPVDPNWSDVGSWRKILEVSDRDADGNALVGDAMVVNGRNCLVRSDTRLVTCVGLDNVVVAETADAVLVAALDDDDGIRTLVSRLRAEGRQEAVRHLAEQRPWGSFRVLLEGPGYKIKEIIVNPGASLSLQYHHHRSEHWVVVAGGARTTCDDRVETLSANQSTYIPIGGRHRLENPGSEPLHIIEVQCGDYVGEDDIVRVDDPHGRLGSGSAS